MSTHCVCAVAYYRASSDKQEASIPDQRREVRAYAAKHGYRIVREYADEGISGDETEKRVQFQRMIGDAEKRRDFEVILCWNQDRFGRFDPLEAGYWIKPLRDAGVRLETIAQGRIGWTENTDILIYNVNQMGKNEFLKDLARNATRGRLRAAREGRWIAGPCPFGYRFEGEIGKKRLLAAEPAASVVRGVFEHYAKLDTSIRSIAEDLNRRGVATPSARSRHWTVVGIARILNNPTYLGDIVWNRRRTGKYIGITNGEITALKPGSAWQLNPQEQWIVTKDTHPALVDRDTYAKVQAKLAKNRTRTTPFRGGGDFLLTGLVICGHCGRRMVGSRLTARKPDGRTYNYRKYQCPTHNLGGSGVCHAYHVPEQTLLSVVVDKIVDRFTGKETMKMLREEIDRQDRQDDDEAHRGQSGVRAAIDRLDKQIQKGNANLALIPADLVAGVAEQVRAWREERDRLAASIKPRQRKPAAEMRAEVDRAIEQLKRLREIVQDGDPAEIRALVREMIDKVELWWTPEQKAKRVQYAVARGLIHVRPDERLKDLFSIP